MTKLSSASLDSSILECDVPVEGDLGCCGDIWETSLVFVDVSNSSFGCVSRLWVGLFSWVYLSLVIVVFFCVQLLRVLRLEVIPRRCLNPGS